MQIEEKQCDVKIGPGLLEEWMKDHDLLVLEISLMLGRKKCGTHKNDCVEVFWRQREIASSREIALRREISAGRTNIEANLAVLSRGRRGFSGLREAEAGDGRARKLMGSLGIFTIISPVCAHLSTSGASLVRRSYLDKKQNFRTPVGRLCCHRVALARPAQGHARSNLFEIRSV